jgi:hypothetical protein
MQSRADQATATDSSADEATATGDPAMRRWLRMAAPLTVVLALTVTTVTVHLVEQPDPTDRAYLSPTSDQGIGARRLADTLARNGITTDRETSTPAAMSAAAAPGSTLLVTTPGLVYRGYLDLFAGLPAGSRVVLVAPSPNVLADSNLDAAVGGPRWTAAAPGPACDEPWATGPAAVRRYRYQALNGGQDSCYAGGVVELDRGAATITLVGAPDVFRNDRAGEHANADVAAALLSRTPRVVWLDLHEHEKAPPGPPEDPRQPSEEGGGVSGGGGRPQNTRVQQGPTVFDAFPPGFWATFALLALAAVALAAASARRVGAPVTEPLPVRVPAAETVRGLGNLYRRARADDASLATIQAAARQRLADHLGVPPEDVTRHLPGVSPDRADRLLGDPDQDLATTAEAVQNLVRRMKGNVT